MGSAIFRTFGTLIILAALGAVGWLLYGKLQQEPVEEASSGRRGGGGGPVPVEVRPVKREAIELRRTFSGTLESSARFVVAPKVSGRVERLTVDLADTVKRGQVVAQLDNDEYLQAIAQAEADIAVAKATLAEARSSLKIAARSRERVETLRERGVASESQFDAAQADYLAKESAVQVAEAQVTRAEAALQTVKIRLGYTTVSATWSGGDDQRVVADRFVDEGDTVAANAPLLSIVELNPIKGVVFATEKEYAQLRPGLPVTLTTDAYPGRVFRGKVARVSPVFESASRQARVELEVENAERLLKPGLFVRAEAVLDRVEDAVVVDANALTKRNETTAVFVVSPDGTTVSFKPVVVGIRQGNRVQLLNAEIDGDVVTLGQQLIDDGSKITVVQPSGAVANGKPADPPKPEPLPESDPADEAPKPGTTAQ